MTILLQYKRIRKWAVSFVKELHRASRKTEKTRSALILRKDLDRGMNSADDGQECPSFSRQGKKAFLFGRFISSANKEEGISGENENGLSENEKNE
jgi:hypothetical protein